MKKSSIMIFVSIILIFFVGIFAIVGFVFVGLNKTKEPLDTEGFKQFFETNGYMTLDSTAQFSEYDFVNAVTVAVESNSNYQIEFFEFNDEASALASYNQNKSNFEAEKSDNVSSSSSISFKNGEKYTQTSNGKYQVTSRIGNTLIYLDIDETYKDTVKALLDEIGY